MSCPPPFAPTAALLTDCCSLRNKITASGKYYDQAIAHLNAKNMKQVLHVTELDVLGDRMVEALLRPFRR